MQIDVPEHLDSAEALAHVAQFHGRHLALPADPAGETVRLPATAQGTYRNARLRWCRLHRAAQGVGQTGSVGGELGVVGAGTSMSGGSAAGTGDAGSEGVGCSGGVCRG